MDPETMAAYALTVATPYLLEFGKGAAKGAASGVGKSVWDWIRGKLTSPGGQEVVADLENSPDDTACKQAVEAALTKLLKAEPHSAADLAKLLQSAGISFASQSANVLGDYNKIGQASSGSTVTIEGDRLSRKKRPTPST